MPDEAKFAVLRSLPYRIPVTCGLCVHASLGAGGWGTCGRHSYAHLKHTGAPRQVSIHAAGTCPDAHLSDAARASLGAHREFLDEESHP